MCICAKIVYYAECLIKYNFGVYNKNCILFVHVKSNIDS